MNYTLTTESLESLSDGWERLAPYLEWQPFFILPAWLAVWWREFGGDARLYLKTLRRNDSVIGVVPLRVKDGEATFIGDTDVCDYQDFVIVPGEETNFYTALLDVLKADGVIRLSLEHLRPEATVLTHLRSIAEGLGCPVECRPTAVSIEMDLPDTWETYLERLEAKQRHEISRKLRKLYQAGRVAYHQVDGADVTGGIIDRFLELFRLSRDDKAAFMTDQMETFFRSVAGAMNGVGLLRFGILEIDDCPVAMVMAFDYRDTVYLYNSAYDPQYQNLSVGLLTKVLCIQESIWTGRKCFDFMKGNEIYKNRLGGRDVPLYSCCIDIERR